MESDVKRGWGPGAGKIASARDTVAVPKGSLENVTKACTICLNPLGENTKTREEEKEGDSNKVLNFQEDREHMFGLKEREARGKLRGQVAEATSTQ